MLRDQMQVRKVSPSNMYAWFFTYFILQETAQELIYFEI
jgi:hypothetical protein